MDTFGFLFRVDFLEKSVSMTFLSSPSSFPWEDTGKNAVYFFSLSNSSGLDSYYIGRVLVFSGLFLIFPMREQSETISPADTLLALSLCYNDYSSLIRFPIFPPIFNSF